MGPDREDVHRPPPFTPESSSRMGPCAIAAHDHVHALRAQLKMTSIPESRNELAETLCVDRRPVVLEKYSIPERANCFTSR